MNLKEKVTKLNRIGKTLEKRLSVLGIETVEDLLFYFPFRYEDYSSILTIASLQAGQEVTIKGKIELINSKRSHKSRKIITEALIFDGSERLRVVWFGQPFISKNLHVGEELFFSGKVKSDIFGLQMVSPAYERVKKETTHTARIVPIYPLTIGITQKQIRFLVSQVVHYVDEIVDWLPDDVRDVADVMELREAIRSIHFPENQDDIAHAEKRLKFDELFVLQLRAEMLRQAISVSKAPVIKFQENYTKEFVASLPFELTKDQKVASWEIIQDLGKAKPMNRLLEGDVGSGKTVVAGMATLNTVLNNYQVAIMAPTEILAKQHYESFCVLLKDHEINVCLLTRSMRFINRDKVEINGDNVEKESLSLKELSEKIESGKINVIIGTHALLSDKIKFKDLALVIVDEQHRFGVEQRASLIRRQSALVPHFLSMTATPIPRSFALTMYGDLDLSIIKQMPKDRKVIKTRLVDDHNRQKAYDFIREQVKQGRQVFVICPLIEQKEKDENEIEIINYSFTGSQEKKSVLIEYEKLNKQIFPDLRVDYLHGKLKSVEKDEKMQNFASGKIDILVSTSVVEVGVDIPNASVMMIEGAENFGLAQLHQFRGRVGRSSHQSYCFLFTTKTSVKSKERLEFFEKTNDGFVLAEYDLQVRGPGAVYGTSQSGLMNLKIATMKDISIIKLARDVARGMDFQKYPSLKKKVGEWEKDVHLE
ncbi:MAG: ATP-dependent DNA helicase RecG [Candidatus Magasanikbacteria bacterium CG1_02_32_51]|uniref:ATP-dependent DNA helicase RecG n=1 Tax=Candidatus Magasanikbacteria bacterium CG1_02_32_51 TaxID=1805238 RepID=A0A1J4U7J6_9BACT|nr:MAG: ATP-dependent DNA helicase RecG [Candidatus Magasanikbacteria bacterium CG1_02_32_51]